MDGRKLKVVQKWNPNYSKSPIIGSVINVSTLTNSKVTDYVGNKVYENNVLKRILVDGGYIENGQYHFYQTDHLGNNRMVTSANAGVEQITHYYPFGTSFADGLNSKLQPNKYNGKELDDMHGLGMYDYHARQLDAQKGRFTSVDPLAEKYYSWSPYVYVMNNPMRWIDKDGRDPGHPFLSPAAAAHDFAKYYNSTSIAKNREFGASIYVSQTTTIGGKEVKIYTYDIAHIGDKEGVDIKLPSADKELSGTVHTHGKKDDNYPERNSVSGQDKESAKLVDTDFYVVTPEGELKKYDPKKDKTSSVTTEGIPSDKKEPNRQNRVNPEKDKPVYYDPEKEKVENR